MERNTVAISTKLFMFFQILFTFLQLISLSLAQQESSTIYSNVPSRHYEVENNWKPNFIRANHNSSDMIKAEDILKDAVNSNTQFMFNKDGLTDSYDKNIGSQPRIQRNILSAMGDKRSILNKLHHASIAENFVKYPNHRDLLNQEMATKLSTQNRNIQNINRKYSSASASAAAGINVKEYITSQIDLQYPKSQSQLENYVNANPVVVHEKYEDPQNSIQIQRTTQVSSMPLNNNYVQEEKYSEYSTQRKRQVQPQYTNTPQIYRNYQQPTELIWQSPSYYPMQANITANEQSHTTFPYPYQQKTYINSMYNPRQPHYNQQPTQYQTNGYQSQPYAIPFASTSPTSSPTTTEHHDKPPTVTTRTSEENNALHSFISVPPSFQNVDNLDSSVGYFNPLQGTVINPMDPEDTYMKIPEFNQRNAIYEPTITRHGDNLGYYSPDRVLNPQIKDEDLGASYSLIESSEMFSHKDPDNVSPKLPYTPTWSRGANHQVVTETQVPNDEFSQKIISLPNDMKEIVTSNSEEKEMPLMSSPKNPHETLYDKSSIDIPFKKTNGQQDMSKQYYYKVPSTMYEKRQPKSITNYMYSAPNIPSPKNTVIFNAPTEGKKQEITGTFVPQYTPVAQKPFNLFNVQESVQPIYSTNGVHEVTTISQSSNSKPNIMNSYLKYEFEDHSSPSAIQSAFPHFQVLNDVPSVDNNYLHDDIQAKQLEPKYHNNAQAPPKTIQSDTKFDDKLQINASSADKNILSYFKPRGTLHVDSNNTTNLQNNATYSKRSPQDSLLPVMPPLSLISNSKQNKYLTDKVMGLAINKRLTEKLHENKTMLYPEQEGNNIPFSKLDSNKSPIHISSTYTEEIRETTTVTKTTEPPKTTKSDTPNRVSLPAGAKNIVIKLPNGEDIIIDIAPTPETGDYSGASPEMPSVPTPSTPFNKNYVLKDEIRSEVSGVNVPDTIQYMHFQMTTNIPFNLDNSPLDLYEAQILNDSPKLPNKKVASSSVFAVDTDGKHPHPLFSLASSGDSNITPILPNAEYYAENNKASAKPSNLGTNIVDKSSELLYDSDKNTLTISVLGDRQENDNDRQENERFNKFVQNDKNTGLSKISMKEKTSSDITNTSNLKNNKSNIDKNGKPPSITGISPYFTDDSPQEILNDFNSDIDLVDNRGGIADSRRGRIFSLPGNCKCECM